MLVSNNVLRRSKTNNVDPSMANIADPSMDFFKEDIEPLRNTETNVPSLLINNSHK